MEFLKQSLADLNTFNAESIAQERVDAQALQARVDELSQLSATQAHRIAGLEEQRAAHDQHREQRNGQHAKHAAELSSLKQAVVDLESANVQDATQAATMQTSLRDRIAELHEALEQQEAHRLSLEARAALDRKTLAEGHSHARVTDRQQIEALQDELQIANCQLHDQTAGKVATTDAIADEYLRRLQQRDADLQASRQSEMLATAELDRVASELDRVHEELREATTELDRVSGELVHVTGEATSELLSFQEDHDATLRSLTQAHAETLQARGVELASLKESMAASALPEPKATAVGAEQPATDRSRHQLAALQTAVAQHARELENRDDDIQAAANSYRQLETKHAQVAAKAISVQAALKHQVRELMAKIAQQTSPQPPPRLELHQSDTLEKKNQQLGEQNERLRVELASLLDETQGLRAQVADANQEPPQVIHSSPPAVAKKRVSFDSAAADPSPNTATALVDGVEVSSALRTALWEKEEFRALAQLEASRLTQLKDECKNWLAEVSLLQNAFTDASAKLAGMQQLYGVVTSERDQLRAHLVNIQRQVGAGTMEALDASAAASDALDDSITASTSNPDLGASGAPSVGTTILDASVATSIGMALDDLRPRTALSERPETAGLDDASHGISISVTSPGSSGAGGMAGVAASQAGSSSESGLAELQGPGSGAPDLPMPARQAEPLLYVTFWPDLHHFDCFEPGVRGHA